MLTALIGGLVMGLASSFHCAGMCGPIGCALLVARGDASPWLSLASAEAGKLVSYVLVGAGFGVFGAGLYGLVHLESAHAVLQWSASLTIIWMGLATIGLVPAMAGLDRLLAPAAAAIAGLRSGFAASGYGGLGLAGLIWGAMPCAMVYLALLNSVLAGSWQAGALMMAGFGLGTVPAVTLSAMGLYRMSQFGRTPSGRWWAGTALTTSGVLGLLLTVPGSPLCIG